jgi:FtsP/CotA-like multicopper oxidase with cupredoxin domain
MRVGKMLRHMGSSLSPIAAIGLLILGSLPALAQGHAHHPGAAPPESTSTPPMAEQKHEPDLHYEPVITPNGSRLPWVMKDGVKEFHLTAEPVKREFAPGMTVNCWGYNGQTPGPTIEAVEGDRVRILVTNQLGEPTSIHWHGIFVPNGMDGVSGLTQKPIEPGETYAYEFTLKQYGTFMYHPHADEMIQIAMGMEGFFIVHPSDKEEQYVDRDFAIFLHEWAVEPGTSTPNPNVMTDFNLFSFNSRVYPGTEPLVVRLGQRVRLRFGNVTQDVHTIHFHGHRFWTTATDGGQIPYTAQWPDTTVIVGPGQTRDVEFVADNPGDWPLHCHILHHPMNAMNHTIPNLIGVDQGAAAEQISKLVDGYMPMGQYGMHEMLDMNMPGPKNTLPMMAGDGQFGPIGMGGMFTVVKIRDGITSYKDPGNYKNPEGTVAIRVGAKKSTKQKQPATYSCPMHPDVIQGGPGKCPKCGMKLVKEK